MWQDYVIAAVVLVFNLTTLPMIWAKVVLPDWTTAPMVIGALTLIVTYSTLGLWFSMSIEIMALILWLILFGQGGASHE